MLYVQAGRLELVSSVEVPRAARKIRATFCPKVHITEPEYIVMGGEDTSVYIYDISKPSYGPLVVTRLQVRLFCCVIDTLAHWYGGSTHRCAPYS